MLYEHFWQVSEYVELGPPVNRVASPRTSHKDSINSLHLIEPTPKFHLMWSEMCWIDVTDLAEITVYT